MLKKLELNSLPTIETKTAFSWIIFLLLLLRGNSKNNQPIRDEERFFPVFFFPFFCLGYPLLARSSLKQNLFVWNSRPWLLYLDHKSRPLPLFMESSEGVSQACSIYWAHCVLPSCLVPWLLLRSLCLDDTKWLLSFFFLFNIFFRGCGAAGGGGRGGGATGFF